MKKFMRIALVFALAGATLVGCTKDYSGDISDLNKKVAEQQSAVTALQNAVSNAQTAADNALASAQNALKEAQAAAKAAADANNDAEVAALTAKVATIEGEIADLEAKVKALDGLEAKLNEVAEQLKKDVDAKVDAALEEVRAELEKAIAQVEGNFSVEALRGTAKYASATWSPLTSKKEKENLAKLVEAFPELAELKKDDKVETFGHLDFIVNPSSVALDDTYKFALIGKDGKDRKVVLGNPTKGFATKAGLNVWNVEVQSPAYKDGKAITEDQTKLALVVENADGVYAQTNFSYTVKNESNDNNFTITANPSPVFKYDDTKSVNSFDAFETLFTVNGTIYDNKYFVIEADPADVEEFGIEIEGSKIILTEAPEDPTSVIKFTITAVSVAGKTDAINNDKHVATLTVNYTKSIAPNADLKAQTVTLAKDKNYVKYDVADFGFSALEWRTVFTELKKHTSTATIYDPETDSETNFVKKQGTSPDTYDVIFFGKNGKMYTGDSYSDAVAFGFEIDPAEAVPGTYPVRITDGAVFCGDGEVTIANPEAHAIKPIPAFCDENGVLQIVGTPGKNDDFITYVLKNAFVTAISGGTVPSTLAFTDEDATYDEDSWVKGNNLKVYKNSDAHHDLYTVRNFSVKYPLFGNDENLVSLDFQAEVISPIYDADGKSIAVTDPTIYVNADEDAKKFSSVEVKDFVGKGTFVAGFEYKGNPFNIYNVWTTKQTGGSDPVYKYWETEDDYVVPPFNTTGHRKDFNTYKPYLETDPWNDWLVSTKDGLRIEIAKEDVTIKNLIALGFSATGADTFYYDKYGTDNFPALYLTGIMFKKLQAVYAKYYDENGNKIGAKTKDEIFIFKHSILKYANPTKAAEWLTDAKFTSSIEGDTFEEQCKFYGITEEQAKEIVGILKEDQAAVALFKKYQNKFGKIDTPAVKPTDEPAIEKNGGRHEYVTKVEVKLSETADTFISASKYTDPYATADDEPTFALKGDAGSYLSGDSVVIPGQVVVTDAWGMVTKKAFNLTIKTR